MTDEGRVISDKRPLSGDQSSCRFVGNRERVHELTESESLKV
jgi:hypothetical protein